MTGFRVAIGNTEELYKQLSVPTSLNQGNAAMLFMTGPQVPTHYTWATCPLNEPLNAVIISARNFGKDYALRATILPAFKTGKSLNLGPFAAEQIDTHVISLNDAYLSEKFYSEKIGDVIFISKNKKAHDIAIYPLSNGDVCVDMGMYEAISFHGDEKLFPILDGFKDDLKFFCEVVEQFVSGIYKGAFSSPPDIELFLRPMRIQKQPDPKDNPMLISNDPFAGSRDGLVEKLMLRERPDVSFDQIGGQKKAVEEIKELAIDLESKNLYDAWGTEPARGILLVGPTGNGKTLLAEALASATKRKFFEVRLAELLSSLWSEQEKILQAIFDKASLEPSIIFFDEIDSIAGRRNYGSGLVQLITVFLQNLGKSSASKNITVLASSNRPDSIDKAVKRAGRFDIIIDVPNPDSEGRVEIFEIHKKIAEGRAEREDIFGNINLAIFAEKTSNMSGSDIKELVRRTLAAKVREEKRSGKTPPPVSTADILSIIKDYEHLENRHSGLGFRANLKENDKKKRYLD